MGTLIFSLLLVVLLGAGLWFILHPVESDTDPHLSKIVSRIAGGIAIGLAVLCLVPMSLKSVGATEVGVPITLGQPGASVSPGPHFMLPWTDVVTMDIKTQNVTLDDDNEVKTVTSDRVQTPVDVVVYFHVDSDKAPTLLLTVGQDYVDKIVKPLVRSTVYDKGSIYSAENIQTQRDNYESAIEAALAPQLKARGITLEKVELKKIQLPQAILDNAQAKINSEEIQKRTKIDAETKVIEATAQAKANQILADSIKQNKDVCQLLLVQALQSGKITQPMYVNPCGTDSGTSPLLTKSVG